MLTNKIMSEKLGIPISKVRRNAKEFLGEDPKATRRSGYKREFSTNDGFFVYLGGYLVSNLGLSFEGARKALETLKPWLLLNGFVPDIPDNAIRVGIDREMELVVKISLWPNKIVSGREYNIQFRITGWKGYKIKNFDDSLGRFCQNIKREELGYNLGPAFEDKKIKLLGKNIHGQDYFEKKDIYIMAMLNNYIWSVLGEGKEKEWREKWKALAKKDPTGAEERIKKKIREHEKISYAEAILPVLSKEGENRKGDTRKND
jgi:hypothetical protein